MSETIRVRLYSNGGEEDSKAFKLLKTAKIPFANYGPTSMEPTPFLEYGYWKYVGLEDIQSFIEEWNLGRLPPIQEP